MADINFGILDTQMPGRIAAIPQQQQAQQAQNAMQLMQVQQSMGQNELAKYQLSAAQRADQTQNAINKAYQNAIGPNGQIDYAAVRRAMAAGGAGSAIPKLESERLTAENLAARTGASTAATNKTNFELTNLKIDRARTSIAAAPNSEAALAAINKNLAAGNIDAEDAGILIKDLGDSATFAEGKARVLKTMLSAKDQLAQQAVTYKDTDMGGYISRQNFNAQGPVGTPIMLPKTPTPGSVPGIAQANIAAARARDEGIGVGGVPAAPVAAPANAMAAPPAAPVNAMIPRPATPAGATAVAPRAMPTSSNLSAAAARRVAEEQAKAQIPKFDRDAGGFITPPTPSNPNGTFVPLVAVQNSKDVQANVKALKMAGYDPTTGKDEISELIEQSTGGILQSGAAGTLGAFNIATSGAKAIGQLETRANGIAFALLNGKLGAGISNEDRKFIERQLGDVANPNVPADKRLASWSEAKKRMLSLGMLAMPDQPQAPTVAATTPKAAPALGAIQDGYRFKGGDPAKVSNWEKVGG